MRAGREKARRNLDKVNVATERHGDELVVTTNFPGHRPFRIFYPVSGNTGFNLEYRIKAPANARIVADAYPRAKLTLTAWPAISQVNLSQGEVLLHLPEDAKYDITCAERLRQR